MKTYTNQQLHEKALACIEMIQECKKRIAYIKHDEAAYGNLQRIHQWLPGDWFAKPINKYMAIGSRLEQWYDSIMRRLEQNHFDDKNRRAAERVVADVEGGAYAD